MNSEGAVAKMRRFFEGRPEVLLSFVFGSYLEGKLSEDAEVDIAIHMIAPEGLDLSSAIKEDLKILHEVEIIDSELLEKMV